MLSKLELLNQAVSLDLGSKQVESNLLDKVKNVNQNRKKNTQKLDLECEFCKMKGFRKKDAFNRHVASHTGEVRSASLFSDLLS
jgi:predicted Zn-ribbon and HTH transcriptional regulator